MLRSLLKHREFQSAQKDIAGAAWLNKNVVFCDAKGEYQHESTSLRKYRWVLSEAGLPLETTMHDLRHNVATYLQEVLKYPPSFVQMLLGHSNPTITLGIYTHLDKKDASKLRPMMDDLDRLFGDNK